jgi:hypothetical protein
MSHCLLEELNREVKFVFLMGNGLAEGHSGLHGIDIVSLCILAYR